MPGSCDSAASLSTNPETTPAGSAPAKRAFRVPDARGSPRHTGPAQQRSSAGSDTSVRDPPRTAPAPCYGSAPAPRQTPHVPHHAGRPRLLPPAPVRPEAHLRHAPVPRRPPCERKLTVPDRTGSRVCGTVAHSCPSSEHSSEKPEVKSPCRHVVTSSMPSSGSTAPRSSRRRSPEIVGGCVLQRVSNSHRSRRRHPPHATVQPVCARSRKPPGAAAETTRRRTVRPAIPRR